MKSSAKSTTISEQEAGELIANINKLVAEAEDMLSDSTSQHAEETIELVNPGYYERLRRAQTGYTAMKTKAIDALKRADATIRANPYESLLAAVGIGFVAGAICFYRRD